MRKLKVNVTAMLLFLFIASFNDSTNYIEPKDSDCEVLLSSIAGSYEGDCKRGKAHGEGTAKGTDQYKGEFKKGYPHGEGTYTWANGNYFTGSFKEGKKEGEGKMVYASVNKDSVKTGFWEDDRYIGKYKEPYKVTSRSAGINNIVFMKNGENVNQITIKFDRGTSNTVFVPAGQLRNGWQNITFPFHGKIDTYIQSGQGTGVGTQKVSIEFDIYEKGNWVIDVTTDKDI